MKASTGDMLWRSRVEGAAISRARPSACKTILYCIAENGDVVMLAAAEEFKQLGRVSLGEQSHSTPAIADGRMYLRTDSHLYSLGAETQGIRTAARSKHPELRPCNDCSPLGILDRRRRDVYGLLRAAAGWLADRGISC